MLFISGPHGRLVSPNGKPSSNKELTYLLIYLLKEEIPVHDLTALISYLLLSVLTICTQTGTCDTRGGDLVMICTRVIIGISNM